MIQSLVHKGLVDDAQGVLRALSASEAFFYRRLQTLPETAGRFKVNAIRSIPFDRAGQMEVDYLDTKGRLALERDGAQHLGDAEAYRRDRRKDALLQEHGYRGLRFFASDVGTRLDQVLDQILRSSMPHQSRCSLARVEHWCFPTRVAECIKDCAADQQPEGAWQHPPRGVSAERV